MSSLLDTRDICHDSLENTRASIWTTDFNGILYGFDMLSSYSCPCPCCCVVICVDIDRTDITANSSFVAVHSGKCGNVAATSFIFGFLFPIVVTSEVIAKKVELITKDL